MQRQDIPQDEGINGVIVVPQDIADAADVSPRRPRITIRRFDRKALTASEIIKTACSVVRRRT